MAKVDLHVHSKYSDHPSEWFLQRIGAAESYTTPEFIYRTAKQRGMQYVTITDHNSIRGALELQANHPADTFVSVESTVYFPEDGCKVHILLFDITPEQFEVVQKIRNDIYEFRDYVRREDLAYSVAHATYSVNGGVTKHHLEKLILLFDIFESINGGRNQRNNTDWQEFLEDLTKEDTDLLIARHNLEPYSNTPWIKGFTGGSDDHAGIFIGKTYTTIDVRTMHQFILAIKKGMTVTEGRHHDFQAMAFSLYKIAIDFIRFRHKTTLPLPVVMILDSFFNIKPANMVQTLAWKKIKKNKAKHPIQSLLAEIIEDLKSINFHETDHKLEILYDKFSQLIDGFVEEFIRSTEKNLASGNLDKLLRNFSSLLPSIFLTIPFISTFTHMYNNRKLVGELYDNLHKIRMPRKKRILWFTDTITELNGVAITLKEIGWLAHNMKMDVMLAACLDSTKPGNDLPPNIINIPSLKSISLPYYEKLKIQIPSLLSSLKKINDYDPDEIYVSTPLSLGLLGLAASRLLDIPITGIFHTDGTLHARQIINDITMTNYVESYQKWFYSACDKILVNTNEYAEILKNRGYRTDKITLFKRGVDTKKFKPTDEARGIFSQMFSLPQGEYLLFAGRISKDKNVELVINIYRQLKAGYPNLQLIIVGDGPDLSELAKTTAADSGIHLLGRLDHEIMPMVYAACDLLIFPSITDTFGRVVAEAQACGLPVLVSNVGGPREIVQHGVTGLIVETLDPNAWCTAVNRMLDLYQSDNNSFLKYKTNARAYIIRNHSLQHFLSGLFRVVTIKNPGSQAGPEPAKTQSGLMAVNN